MISEPFSMAFAATCCLALMPLVIRMRAFGYSDVDSPQHVHTKSTSRLGGVALFLAYVLGILIEIALGPARPGPMLALLACASPVFLAGILEDVTRKIPPKHRLVAAVVSAVLASVLAGGVIVRLDLPYVDGWLTYRVVAVLLTCFMVAGACNALNLIDGANGLAGGTALLMFIGMAAMAVRVGDNIAFVQAATMIGAIAGFLFWNYPRARVFLGDGGAYFIGFVYAELSIQIVAHNEQVSAWFVVMLAAYPIMETLYSIYRRKIQLRTPSTEPDAMHLHSLVYHRVTLPAEHARPDADHERANGRVALRLWPHGLICLVLALGFHDQTGSLIACLAAYATLYVIHYKILWKIHRTPPDDPNLAFQEQRRANANQA